MKHLASAPANIALIKYMGKSSTQKNLPANPSFSYTLDNLRCFVELELHGADKDIYQPLTHPDCQQYKTELKAAAMQRFLKHFSFLKHQFDVKENFIVRSAINFPMNAGLASSAASFAALTRCACECFSQLKNQPLLSINQQAQLSRQGSGSSCRSFYSPWCLWQDELVEPVALPYESLHHQVILIENQPKKISSSQAHERIPTSLLYAARPKRATTRLQHLLDALKQQAWQQAYEIVWQEFWDMHVLFETSQPPFGYMQAESLAALIQLRDMWQQYQDGPLITMDAGCNIHLLYRADQTQLMDIISAKFAVL
ncbi:MAG: diphosphomevalonate decarboxylase [Pseudomonadota bacterium]